MSLGYEPSFEVSCKGYTWSVQVEGCKATFSAVLYSNNQIRLRPKVSLSLRCTGSLYVYCFLSIPHRDKQTTKKAKATNQ